MKGRKTGRHCVSSGWVGSPFTKTFLNSQPIDSPAWSASLECSYTRGAWCLSDCAGVCLRADQPLVPGGLEHVRVKCGTAFVWGGTLRLVRRQKQSDVGCCMAAANGTPDHVTLAGCLDHRSKDNRRHFYDRQRGCQEQRSGADASGHCQCS